MNNYSLFIVHCSLLLILLSACARTPPVVKIGLVAPFEGRYRPVGYDVIYSARLAIRETNLAGGIGPYRVALVALDDGGDPELAQATAASLALDPVVVAVVGHWRPETTAAAAPIYQQAGLPFIATSGPTFAALDALSLPDAFREQYAAVTPFDEEAGPYAGPAYDALQLLMVAMTAASEQGPVDRTTLADALTDVAYEGFGGRVYGTVGARQRGEDATQRDE